MLKLWFKFIKGEKIINSLVYSPTDFDINLVREYIEEVSNSLDQPTPLILNKHITHLQQFSTTFFTPSDYVENVYFDKLVLEIFDESKKKAKK